MADELLSRINRDALLKIASSTFPNEPNCQFDSSTPVVSPGYVIFVVSFPDSGRRCAARFPSDQQFPLSVFSVKPLQYIAQNFPDLPAPRVHSFSEYGHESPVGAAYMLLDWIDGSPLEPWSLDAPPVVTRHKVLSQLANFIIQMILKDAGKEISFYGIRTLPSYTKLS